MPNFLRTFTKKDMETIINNKTFDIHFENKLEGTQTIEHGTLEIEGSFAIIKVWNKSKYPNSLYSVMVVPVQNINHIIFVDNEK